MDFVMMTGKSKPGDFAGVWSSMTDKEETKLLVDLEKIWRRWTPKRIV